MTQDDAVDFSVHLWQQRLRSHRNDLTLRVGTDPQEAFLSNSDILMSRSVFLRRNVPVPGSETERRASIMIPEISPDEFRKTFYYLYSNDISVFTTVDDLANGLYGAKRLEHPPLAVKCREKLYLFLENDPVPTSMVLFKHTEKFLHRDEEQDLFQKIDSVVRENVHEVLSSPDFVHVDYDSMKSIVSDNTSAAGPMERLLALNTWAESTLLKKQVPVDERAKLDLVSEVVFQIPLQNIPLSVIYKKIAPLKFLSEELLIVLSKFHFDFSLEIPFFSPDEFQFESKLKAAEHRHDPGQFTESADFEWKVEIGSLRQQHATGSFVDSELFSGEGDATTWKLRLYPNGEDSPEEMVLKFGGVNSVDDKYTRGVHAHWRIKILAGDKTLKVCSEGASLFTVAGGGPLWTLDKPQSLPQEWTIQVQVQWSAPRPVFWLPASTQVVDGTQVAKIATSWRVSRTSQWDSAGKFTNISSPLFGRDGFLWYLRMLPGDVDSEGIPKFRVRLEHLPAGRKKLMAAVQHLEEKEFKRGTISAPFRGKKVGKTFIYEVEIQYKID